MANVALDLFRLPPVVHDGKTFDTIAGCVDRLSGGMVVVPLLDKGLTGREVALKMIDRWASSVIPSIVEMYQGSHFTAAWWTTMCANLGIRQIYSQAYHHASNCRAERAGQQVIEVLRKVALESDKNWVSLLPKVVNFCHDTPSDLGFSPHQIVFGWDRPLANLPYTPQGVSRCTGVF